jgi:tetratricopeptide (TPR) repeat protein
VYLRALLAAAVLVALLLWAGGGEKLRELFWTAGEPMRASAPSRAQTPATETIDSLLAKSAKLPGMREAIEQTQPYALNVCGQDKQITIDPQIDAPNHQEEALQAQADRILRALGTTLAASSDDATQALGLQMLAVDQDGRAAAQAQLFALAGKTKSASAYRVAFAQCRLSIKPPGCSAISAKRLTELDPENADSWLHLADEELAAKRTDAAAAAFARAAQAKRYDLHYAEPFKLAQPAIENLQTPLEQMLASHSVVGIAAAFPIPQFQQTMKRCEKRAVDQDPKRHAECHYLGNLLAYSDTIVGSSVGLAIQERVARSAAELEAIKIKRDAMRYVQMDALDFTRGLQREDIPYSCEVARRTKDYIARLIRMGEIGLMHQELQRQNLTEEQAAVLYRARKPS